MIEPNEVWIFILVFGVMYVGFGILSYFLWQGKLVNLVSGYNTLPKHKKDEYDKEKLGKFTARFLWLTMVFMTFVLIAAMIDSEPMIIVTVVIMIVTMIGGLIYGNTGNRLKKDRNDGIARSRYDR